VKRKGMIAITIVIFIVIAMGYKLFNKESIERRILEGIYYESNTEKASDVLEFSINPKDYAGYKGKNLGERRLIMQKYDTKVYLEPILNQGDSLWIGWSFDNNWWRKSGTCFTYRDIIFESGKRLYSSVNTNFEAADQDGNRVNEDWGGGGSTYNYGFRIEKQVFENCKSINIKLSDFNILNYQINFK
jgi:hypothetical protein